MVINSNNASHKDTAPRGNSWALLQVQYQECLSNVIKQNKKKELLQFKTSFNTSSRINILKIIWK